MTVNKKETLNSYQANRRLIEHNKKKIDEEKMREIQIIKGMVRGSSKDFPYTECRFPVQMYDPILASRSTKKLAKLRAEVIRAEIDIEEAESIIEGIEGAELREIFTYRFVDGMSLSEIASAVGYSKGRISQLISSQLKD